MKTIKTYTCGPRWVIRKWEVFMGRNGEWGDIMDSYVFETKKDALFEIKADEEVVRLLETVYVIEG